MDLKLLEYAKDRSINAERLYDENEQDTLDWLLKNRAAMSHEPWFELIKGSILCMDTTHINYQNSSAECKTLVDKLLKNEEVVDVVLITLFQWFATNVGFHTMKQLLKDIEEHQQR